MFAGYYSVHLFFSVVNKISWWLETLYCLLIWKESFDQESLIVIKIFEIFFSYLIRCSDF